jgi:hypothetical protein
METVVNPSETEEELHKPAFGDNGERLKSFSPFDPLRNARSRRRQSSFSSLFSCAFLSYFDVANSKITPQNFMDIAFHLVSFVIDALGSNPIGKQPTSTNCATAEDSRPPTSPSQFREKLDASRVARPRPPLFLSLSTSTQPQPRPSRPPTLPP